MRHIILICWAILLSSSLVLAGELKINVQQVKVYKDTSGSQVISTLFKGDIVKVSNKNPPGFQKVLIQAGGSQQIGYIKNADLGMRAAGAPAAPGQRPMNQQQHGRQMVRRGAPRGMANRMGASLYGGIDYQSQGTRTNTETNGNIDNYGTMGGIATRFGASVQFPLSPKISGKIFGEMKSVSVSGTGSQQVFGSSTATPQTIFLNESFISVGAIGQYYFSPSFWAGVGAAYDIASSGTLQVGQGTPVALTCSSSDPTNCQLVNFIYLFGTAGYDFELSRQLYLSADVRLGALMSNPLILEGDLSLALTYAF